LLLASACGGGPSSPGVTATAPPAPSALSALLLPAFGVNGAVLSWTPVSNADGYILDVGTASAASDFASVQVPSTENTYTVGGLLVGRSYFARVKAQNRAGTSTTSDEVRIESVDLRHIIDALYFGSGPLIPRDGFTACVSYDERWITYASGVTVRLTISASTTSVAAQEAVTRAANEWIATTFGTNSVIVQLTGDPDPHPADNEITIATHPDPVGQGCSFDRGCTFLTIRRNVLVAARAIIGPSNANFPSSYAHDAVGHGALGMCHIDSRLIGGARNSLMGGGPNTFSCPSPSDTCIAASLTPHDSAAARAAYGSGLPRGASRVEFLAAGLVRAVGAPLAAEVSGSRRFRIGPEAELVIVDHQ
jgi:hypothetical protein